MRPFATICTVALLLFGVAAGPAQAQVDRNGQDVIWARDIDGATITLDGVLDEEVWQQAEFVRVTLNNDTFYTPGGGWASDRDDIVPSDPVDATVHYLRDGNTLYIAVDAKDASIGGRRNFFQMDGIVISLLDKRNRAEAFAESVPANWFNGQNTDEFFYSWMNRQMVEDSVGIDPEFFGNEAARDTSGAQTGLPDLTVWDGRYVINGVANDDFNGNAEPTPDVGYTMELQFNLETLGYDMTAPDGDRMPSTFGIYDLDFAYPTGAAGESVRTRAWWQNPWGGDMPWGAAFVLGHPDVTVNSGPVPAVTKPELRLLAAPPEEVITVDGMLDEDIWGMNPQISLQYQASEDDLDQLPGFGPFYTHWFRPGSGDDAPPVVDPSRGDFRLFHQAGKLYIGLDTDDQAINGRPGEGGGDGFRFVMRNLNTDSTYTPGGNIPALQFEATIDSSGVATPLRDAFENPAVQVAAFLKGASTAADPTDADEGYQMEMVIDLEMLGYPLEEAGNQIWFGINYLEGDDLEIAENSYNMRTWFLTERGSGPMIRTFLDASTGVSNTAVDELPNQLELLGNYPNPFNPSTVLRYTLPQAGEVEIQLFDVLGRQLQTLSAGRQGAGTQGFTVDASGLASGLYLYRVTLKQGATIQATATGRMTLVR